MREDIEWLVGTDHDELLRLRFSRLKSPEICQRLLEEKCKRKGVSLDESVLKEKAKGLSSAIESALNYWKIKEDSLNTRVLSRYYAFLQFTIAEQVASVNNTGDLKEAQKHTEQGHGLSTVNRYTGENFLDNYYCYFRGDGHFYYYLQQIGYDKNEEFFVSRRLKSSDELENEPTVSLADLFRRIPELQGVIEEYIGQCPLVLDIGYDSIREHAKTESRREKYAKDTGTFQFQAPPETDPVITTNVAIYPVSEKMDVKFLEGLTTPFTNFIESRDELNDQDFISCDFVHPNQGLWWNSIKTYKSSYSPTSLIIPLFDKISDPIIINYALMYTLSIIVRYLPDVWYEMTAGKMNNIGNLVDYYISVFDHTVPHLILERITGKVLHISSPGSLEAPV
ncbi:MAG: hypothetical protein PF518_07295 [Spirochaetaceae bacterium]|jgi:hypothetical protein|nr:hypothetical protein [Spirochaetaceae bacterium]